MIKKGIASLIIVFIVTMILTFVVLAWQSRLLLVVHRSVGFSDALVAGYNAETEINDILGRFLGGFTIPNSGSKSLSDGTLITTVVNNTADNDTLSVIAKRQFATNKIQISRNKSEQTSSNYDQVEIVMGIDCTHSMDEKADPDCIGSSCVSRMSSAKKATLTFIDQILAMSPDERVKYLVGLEVFRIKAMWLMEPTNNFISLRQQVENGFGNRVSNSSACVFSDPTIPGGGGETSLGKAVTFSDEYFTSHINPRNKQIYILITDGVPNVSLNDLRCGTTQCASSTNRACADQAINYLACGMADTNTFWTSSYHGLRPPESDIYAVTVMSSPNNANEMYIYEKTVNVFSNTNYVKNYFNSTNAENLPAILQDIFGKITENVYQYSIKRVVPSLGL
jgi:hypothetical protein